MLPHTHTMFHPYRCGLHGGAAAIAVAQIGYDDRGGCCWDDQEEEMIVIDYFPYTDARLHWITTSPLLLLVSTSSGNDDL
jgi:hypothetical protein